MGGVALLAEARTAGLVVYTSGDQLIVRGPRSLQSLAQQVLAAKTAVLAALAADPDVVWRVEAMRNVATPTGPLLFLNVRQLPAGPKGLCLSCGKTLPTHRNYRCDACVHAAQLVVQEMETQRQYEDAAEDGGFPAAA
jgi:hypothetical protein